MLDDEEGAPTSGARVSRLCEQETQRTMRCVVKCEDISKSQAPGGARVTAVFQISSKSEKMLRLSRTKMHVLMGTGGWTGDNGVFKKIRRRLVEGKSAHLKVFAWSAEHPPLSHVLEIWTLRM